MAAEAFLFDLDGTIWDSHPWLAGVAAKGNQRREAQYLTALRARRPAATLLRNAGISRAAFARACGDGCALPLYPEAATTLDRLAQRGVLLGAVTNLPMWLARPMLDGLGLSQRFGSLVTYERTSRRKPHPDPLLLSLEELAADSGPNAWYVGDSATDARAAMAAGMSFAWVSWGYESTPPATTDLVVGRFSELLDI